MKTEITLADYAAVEPATGKFTLVGGGFTRIAARSFPCVHASMFLFVRFHLGKDDAGKNKVEVRIVGEKGALFRAEAMLNVGSPAGSHQAPFAFHLVNTPFEKPGLYNIEVVVNGQIAATESLTLAAVESPPGSKP